MAASDADTVARWLARLVRDGTIREEEAAALYGAWANGDSAISAVPIEPGDESAGIGGGVALALSAGILTDLHENRVVGIPSLTTATGLAIIAAARSGDTRAGARIGPRVAIASPLRREHLADMVQSFFEDQVNAASEALATGRITIAEFQQEMALQLRLNLLANSMAGGNGVPDFGLLNAQVPRQLAYLSRWMDQLALRLANGGTLTEEGLAARGAMYAGMGRAAFYQTQERDAAYGLVCKYEAADDQATCSPCLAAEGHYLPGTGPYPGAVCLGRGRCRCRRLLITDTAIYAQLTGTT